MPKNNFLLVDLNESKTKKLAETITSNTSRKILNYLAEKEHDTEQNISQTLNIPISTIHYHLQKLMEAKLINVEEFHYSPKGREVNHYKLANKYIIITPKKVSGLKDKLKGILPVGFIVLGIGAIIKLVQSRMLRGFSEMATKAASLEETAELTQEAVAARVPETAAQITQQPDIAFWFMVGSFSAIAIYLIIALVKELWKR